MEESQIPAQPMSAETGLPAIGDLLRQTKDIVMKRYQLFFIIAGVPAIIRLAGDILLALSPGFVFFSVILGLVSVLVAIIAGIATIKVMADEKLMDWKLAFSKSTSLFLPVLWVAILVAIVTIIGFILLFIPGIYLAVALGFYMFVIVLENKRGWDSAQRSRELVRGNWWAVFGRWIVFGIIIIIITAILGGIVSIFQSQIVMAIYTFAIAVILPPFSTAYGYLMYKSLLKMKRKR